MVDLQRWLMGKDACGLYKPGKLSPVPRAHINADGENSKRLSSDFYTLNGTPTHPHSDITHTCNHKQHLKREQATRRLT